jgi:hypothetical protein
LRLDRLTTFPKTIKYEFGIVLNDTPPVWRSINPPGGMRTMLTPMADMTEWTNMP